MKKEIKFIIKVLTILIFIVILNTSDIFAFSVGDLTGKPVTSTELKNARKWDNNNSDNGRSCLINNSFNNTRNKIHDRKCGGES